MTTDTITQHVELQNALDHSYALIQDNKIQEGFEALVENLNEVSQSVDREVIRTIFREECLQHPIAKIILQEPMTKRSYQQPRGYAGDAELIDYMYRLKTCSLDDSYLARELHGLVHHNGNSKSVRWRAHHLANEINRIHARVGRPIDVISIASGHQRELAYVQNAQEKISRFVCIDQDIQSNQVVRSAYSNYHFLEIIDESISYVLKRKLDGQTFDFIYSAGLFDYLNDRLASKMIEILYGNLRPGGQLLIPNFVKGIKEQTYMETFMRWDLIYRNEEDMLELCKQLPIQSNNIHLYRDEIGNVVFMRITK